MSDVRPFDPERVIRTLAKHNVRYILVGAMAARLQGFPRMTADTDITPENTLENTAQLAAALREVDARVFTDSLPEGLAFDCSAATLARSAMWNLVTDAGRIDVVFEPSGTAGYEDLSRDAVAFEVFDAVIHAASLGDIVRMKEAADRPQDRHDVLLLREIMRRTSHPLR